MNTRNAPRDPRDSHRAARLVHCLASLRAWIEDARREPDHRRAVELLRSASERLHELASGPALRPRDRRALRAHAAAVASRAAVRMSMQAAREAHAHAEEVERM